MKGHRRGVSIDIFSAGPFRLGTHESQKPLEASTMLEQFTCFISALWVYLDLHFAFCFQNTFKGRFSKIIFCLGAKTRKIAVKKNACKIDVLRLTQNSLWLMDFDGLNVRIISDNYV